MAAHPESASITPRVELAAPPTPRWRGAGTSPGAGGGLLVGLCPPWDQGANLHADAASAAHRASSSISSTPRANCPNCHRRGRGLACISRSAGQFSPGGLETIQDASGTTLAMFATWSRPGPQRTLLLLPITQHCQRGLLVAERRTRPSPDRNHEYDDHRHAVGRPSQSDRTAIRVWPPSSNTHGAIPEASALRNIDATPAYGMAWAAGVPERVRTQL